MNKIVTVMAIGETGVGKSQNGCAFLQSKDAFIANSNPDSCTTKTCAQNSIINGITRYYIDTQGWKSSDGLDGENIEQMVQFLKEWEHGINAIYIMINVQDPRFTQAIQKMMKMINAFFNNPEFWNLAGIVFTRCFSGHFDRQKVETEYRKLIIDFIKTLPGCENLNPQIPCFFVDSVRWEIDQSTKNEYIRMFEFAYINNTFTTQKVKETRPEYKNKEEEILKNVLINTRYEGTGENKRKILTYQNQKRFKLTNWNDEINYTNPIPIETWDKTLCTIVNIETKTETSINKEEMHDLRGTDICPFLLLFYQIYRVTETCQDYHRKIITDPDGNVSYGYWQLGGCHKNENIEMIERENPGNGCNVQ